jgi:hypothetical protein
MWPRLAELAIAAWLAASPFVFSRGEVSAAGAMPWLSDMVCAALIASCALLSFTRPLAWLHLAELAVAAWLLGYGFLASPEPLPALQNDILVAMVLPMFAIIPNRAMLPPRSWREYSTSQTPDKSPDRSTA